MGRQGGRRRSGRLNTVPRHGPSRLAPPAPSRGLSDPPQWLDPNVLAAGASTLGLVQWLIAHYEGATLGEPGKREVSARLRNPVEHSESLRAETTVVPTRARTYHRQSRRPTRGTPMVEGGQVAPCGWEIRRFQ